MVATGHARRSWATHAAVRLLAVRVNRKFREEMGLSYGAHPLYLPIGRSAIVAVTCDCDQTTALQVARWLELQVEHLAEHGPSFAELDAEFRSVGLQNLASVPDDDLGWLASQCEDELLGLPPHTLPERRAEVAAVTPAEVAVAARALRKTLIVSGPGLESDDVPDGQRLPLPPDVWQGTAFHPVKGFAQTERIVVGRSLTWVDGDDIVSMTPQQIAALEVTGDGLVAVWRFDGVRLLVERGLWRDGDALIAKIQGMVPARLIIPRPARPDGQRPVPPTRRQRIRNHLVAYWRAYLVYGTLTLLVVGIIGWLAFSVAQADGSAPEAWHYFRVALPVIFVAGLLWTLTVGRADRDGG